MPLLLKCLTTIWISSSVGAWAVVETMAIYTFPVPSLGLETFAFPATLLPCEQFYIARDLQLYYPLEELMKLIKKCRIEDEIEDLKIAAFTNILMQTSGDMTRFIRHIKAIVGTEYQEEFFEDQKEIATKVVDILLEQGKVTTTTIREVIRSNDEIVQELERSMEKTLTKVKKNETKN